MRRGSFVNITLDSAVSMAKQMLNLEDGAYDPFLLKLADDAIRNISGQKKNIKQTKTIDIVNYRMVLPDGFSRLIAVSVNTNGGPNQIIYVDSRYISGVGDNSDNSFYTVKQYRSCEIIGDELIFSTDITADKATVTYLGYNLDKDCFMVLYDYQERAVVAYICYKFALRFYGLISRDVRDEYKREYIAQKAYVRGYEFTNQFEQQKAELSYIYNSLLQDNNKDI